MILIPAVINHGTRSRVDSKRRDQIGGIKPVDTPISYRINQVIVKELALKTLAKLNPTTTKEHWFLRGGVGVSGERSNETEKEKGEFQGKLRKDEQRQKGEELH